MEVSLETAVAYRALRTFFLVVGGIALLASVRFSASGCTRRKEFYLSLLMGTLLATIVCLPVDYDGKGAWHHLVNGWLRPAKGFNEYFDSAIVERAERAHRRSIFLTALLFGGGLLIQVLWSFRRGAASEPPVRPLPPPSGE